MNVKNIIDENKLIVIMRGLNEQQAVDCANAMYNGGVRLIEVTFDGSKPVNETGDIIKRLNKEFESKLFIGAGTVVTKAQLNCAKDAGAKYIISPNTDKKIIKLTKKMGIVSIPGALTPTEVLTAHNAGADYVKIFPIAAFNESYLKDLSGPVGYVKYMAVGGVDINNMHKFFKMGAMGVGIGGGIVNKEYIKSGQFDKITEMARDFTNKIKEITGGNI